MDVRKILEEATKREASDIFIIAGRPLTYKSKGAMNTLDDQRMEPKDTFQFVSAIYSRSLVYRGSVSAHSNSVVPIPLSSV